jgi:hypothetical protein
MPEKLTLRPEIIDNLVDGYDYDPDDFRMDYSGRSMYGRTCFGYTGDGISLFVFHLAVAIHRADTDGDDPDMHDLETMIQAIGEPVTDSLGRGTIFYWPNVAYSAGE